MASRSVNIFFLRGVEIQLCKEEFGCCRCTYVSHLWHWISRLVGLSDGVGTRTSKHYQVQQRVGAESIGSVHRHAGRLTGTVQAAHHLVLSLHMLYHLPVTHTQLVFSLVLVSSFFYYLFASVCF